ncbi:MAG: GAF domain-containing protein, partial [Ferruginibacter sp.]|nr:GAF domain-containing protein [Ferruginibacter sp.]
MLSLTGNGLVIIDSKGNLLQNINRNTGLQNESIYANYLDKKGALWLALDNGISRIEINSPVTQFTLQSGINSGVLTMKRFDGNLYIGTSNGLFVYDGTRQIFNPVPGIAQNQVFALVIDGDELLVGSDGLFAIKNKKAFTIHPSVSGDFTLSGLYIPKKYPDLLLAGGTFGLGFFDRKKSTIVSGEKNPWNFKGLIPGITERIVIFSEDKDGTIWAGSSNGVAYRLSIFPDEKNNPNLTKIKIDTIKSNKDINNFVGGVTPINGTTYFQADSFLYIFDKNKKQFVIDTIFGIFPNGNAATDLFITEDQLGRVWINIEKQTRLAIPQKEGGYRIENAGLNSLGDYSFSDVFAEKNGITWIATTDALIRFDENLEKETDQSFKTILRHITAGKTALSTDIPNGQKPFSLSFKNNTLRFEYAAPFFEQENKTRYQTWLEGFENDWSPLDNNYYKEYTNLSAGKYIFHVRAVNTNGKQSAEATYSFEILPPWYRTWWAYLLYLLAAAAIIYSLIRWRTHQLHEKHRELEKTVADRTVQLSQRVEELAVINSVQEGLVREMDMEGIYELVGEKIREIFNAQVIDIVTYDRAANQIEDKYAFEKGDRTLLKPRQPKGFRKHVIDTKELLMVNENVEKVSREYDNELLIGEMPKSMVLVPMIVGEEVKGIISLQHMDKEHAFTEADVNLLTTLANSMSVALESARLFDETNRLLKETEQRTAELAVINSVQEGLAKELDMQGIYDLVGDRVQKLFHTHAVVIATLDLVNRIEHFNYVFENGEKYKLDSRPVNKLREKLIDKK